MRILGKFALRGGLSPAWFISAQNPCRGADPFLRSFSMKKKHGPFENRR
jgi:hypothetical protein